MDKKGRIGTFLTPARVSKSPTGLAMAQWKEDKRQQTGRKREHNKTGSIKPLYF